MNISIIIWGIFFCLVTVDVFAQLPPGLKEIAALTNEIRQVNRAIIVLISPIGGLFGLLGGIRIYNNWQCGKNQIDVQVIGWLGSCIFLQLLSVFIAGIFGI